MFYRPFESWAHTSEWRVTLPPGEEALAVAAGTTWVATVTSGRMLRVFSHAGAQRQIVTLEAGPHMYCSPRHAVPFTSRGGFKVRLLLWRTVGLADIVRHVTGYQFILKTRVRSVLKQVASNIHQAQARGRSVDLLREGRLAGGGVVGGLLRTRTRPTMNREPSPRVCKRFTHNGSRAPH